MADATVTSYPNVADPVMEVVVLTVSDGETFKSRKFSKVLGAVCTGNSNVDAHLNVTWTDGSNGAGAVATINWAAQTDKLCTLVLFGSLGN